MRLSLSQEQEDLRDTVRKFVDHHYSDEHLRAVLDGSYEFDPQEWKRLAEEIGLQGLLASGNEGGSGASEADVAVVLEELGRSLYSGPYLSTVLFQAVLKFGEEGSNSETIRQIVNGESVPAVAIVDAGGTWTSSGTSTTAEHTPDGFVISGEKSYVIDADTASIFLVLAMLDDGPAWFEVERTAPGLDVVVEKDALDLTREIGSARFGRVPARLVVDPARAGLATEHLMDCGAVYLAAEMVGGAMACLDQAVSWSDERVQFGRAIGSFQSIKHQCADVLVEIEAARALTRYAACAVSEGTYDRSTVTSMAKAAAANAFTLAATTNIQIHGGIGFTWEHPAHLYLRRARSSAVIFGDSYSHMLRIPIGGDV